VNILFNIFDNIEQAQQITTPNKSQTFSSMTTAGTYYYNKYQQQREAADNVVNTQFQGFSKTKTLLFN